MRGDLSETTVAGACRSLATREASGALLIDAAEGTGLIRFREGRIVGVASPSPGARVGDRLVGAGILERNALDEVLDDQRDGGETRPLPRALVERGLVPEEAVERVLSERMLDALLGLTQLHAGTLLFLTDEELHADVSRADDEVEPPNLEAEGPSLEVDDAFRSVTERQEELDEIRMRVPDSAVVPTRTPLAEDALRGEGVDADATTILAELDGTRSVGEVAVAAGYGVLEVTRIVEGLVSAGLVELERPRDAVGTELDDAIRQLSGQTASSDSAVSHPADRQGEVEEGEVRPPAASAELNGPLIEAELPHDVSEPPAPVGGPGPPPGLPPEGAADDVQAAKEAQETRDARETGVSWDDLFGGGDTRGAPAARSAEPPTGPPREAPARPPAEPTGSADEEVHEPSRTSVDPPPFFADTRPAETSSGEANDEPSAPDRHHDRRSTDEDTDVSEFLRELSRLALGEDAPPTPRRSGVEPKPPTDAPGPAASQDEERPRRAPSPADTEHARRRRGFFGRG